MTCLHAVGEIIHLRPRHQRVTRPGAQVMRHRDGIKRVAFTTRPAQNVAGRKFARSPPPPPRWGSLSSSWDAAASRQVFK
ncbi:hypothetical protein LZ30DRAFT_697624 [Colletotrichum cereale]|nr:hypothetical protein LZ30DRAFT_697624 [Colletotrichum cereale]